MQKLDQVINQITAHNEQNSSTQSRTRQEQQIFSEQERAATGYLFAKLLVLYANSFYLVYPSAKEVDFAKREYAKQIGKFNKEQIDTCMKHLARLAVTPERENRMYREPNIPAVLALLESVNKRDTAHRLFLPVPPESEEVKTKRYEEGIKQTTEILSMFGDDEK